jgi:hypothetical protein
MNFLQKIKEETEKEKYSECAESFETNALQNWNAVNATVCGSR